MAKKTVAPAPSRTYLRFPLADRAQHLVMLLSFTTLGITGLVQKFPLNPISLLIVRGWGGIENIRATHHVAATVLMLVAIYHLIGVGYKAFVLRRRMTMLPTLQDVRDAWTAFAFNIGIGSSRPQMGRYTFEEKAEYWALVWGIIIMGLTGFMMWNPLATVKLLPGEFIPAAKAAHGAEAVLAVLAIIVWHMYGVHLKRFNKAMWHGRLTEEEMLHEHPLELADLKAGLADRTPAAAALRRRKLIYYPVAGLLGVALLFAVYGFVNGEQTAITTVPPQIATIPIFVPQTPTPLPPTPTPIPSPTPEGTTESATGSSTSPTWMEVGPIFAARCLACHGQVATAGLNLSTYEDALKGGKDGAVIVPNDAANSKLFIIQSAGGHMGQLSAEELAIVKAWIEAGAPEK
jgi:cytochrome b subunit of formate dehydrogenase/mono/diheme cytochrome c family protein